VVLSSAGLNGTPARINKGDFVTSRIDEEINSLNPLRMPPDRDTARTIFRYGVNGTCATFIVGTLAVAWHNWSRFGGADNTAFELLLAGLFVLFALWVKQKGTTWPLAILMMLATVFALSSLADNWAELLGETLKYRIFMSAPNALLLVAQLHNVRALRYLLESGGSFASPPPSIATQHVEHTAPHEPHTAITGDQSRTAPFYRSTLSPLWVAAAVTVLVVAGLLWYRWPKAEPSPDRSSAAAPLEDYQAAVRTPPVVTPSTASAVGWRVVKDSANSSCEMLTTLDTEYGMTFISLNYHVVDERITFAFLAQHVVIPEGTPYVSFDFDGNRQEWQQMPAIRRSGENVGTGFSLELTTDFIDAMSNHRDLTVKVNGQPVFRIDTTEAADALKQLGACAIDVGTGG